jgi:hypothetical protein
MVLPKSGPREVDAADGRFPPAPGFGTRGLRPDVDRGPGGLAQSLRGLGVPAGEIPVEVADQTNLYRSLNADKRVLVVLGNVAGRCYRRRDMPGRGDQPQRPARLGRAQRRPTSTDWARCSSRTPTPC